MRYQHTIKTSFSCKGIGLHTGKLINLTVHPAAPDSGIQFLRTDLPGRQKVKAGPDTVSGTSFATTVSGNGWYISTVEHLMSALVGMGVDNALIEIDGEEVPIMDGSALPFAYLIQSVGTRGQAKLRKYIIITKPIIIREEGKSVALQPYDGFRVEYEIDFEHPVIRTQHFNMDITPDTYIEQVAGARTFGFLSEIQALQANGFAAGGTLDNAIVLGNYSVLNKGGLRFPDEFVRHKVLDGIGDLFMVGLPILGRFTAYRSGHGLNNRLARKLISDRKSWRVAEFPSELEQSFAADVAVAAWAR